MDSGFLVTEHAEGQSLTEAVGAGGPLAANATHRLALAVLTALASVHRTGQFHGDLGPHTVILGADGPHVLRGTRSDEGSQAADMFAWAALVAFAATGRDPFGEVDKRRLYGAADLGTLQGELRELVADCLAEDPEERPGAEEALLRLLGQSGALETALPDALPPPRRRPRALLLTAGAIVIVLAFGALGYVLTPKSVSARPAAATAPPSTPKAAGPPKPPAATRQVALPDGAGTLWEDAADPVRITAYNIEDKKGDTTAYARTPDGTRFTRTGGDNVSTPISPDNKWLATVNELHLLSAERLDVGFTNRLTGEKFIVPTVTNPRWGVSPLWSPDSRLLLLSMMERDEQVQDTLVRGFILINVERRTATVVETTNDQDLDQFRRQPANERPAYFFRWAPGGTMVSAGYLTPENRNGIRYWDLTGKVVRSMHWVGRPLGQAWFSPSGKYFVTTSCSKDLSTCVWETETGKRFTTVPPRPGYLYGWYDESHLIVGAQTGKKLTIEVTNLEGKIVRKLAEFTMVKGGRADVRFDRI